MNKGFYGREASVQNIRKRKKKTVFGEGGNCGVRRGEKMGIPAAGEMGNNMFSFISFSSFLER